MDFYKFFLTAWITTTIFTIIPNIILLIKIIRGVKIKDILNGSFIHFMSLYMFVVMTMILTGVLIYNKL